MATNNDTFHLGLTMAGAVSAGAFTGGVMDYLFEALDKWERAKTGDLPGVDPDLVPKHNVIIDAMGGTSAGGMTTLMAALYAIHGKVNPVTSYDPNDTLAKKDNIFWDSWVLLDDEPDEKTLSKALSISDLKEGKILSMLNSEFIDSIASKAFDLGDAPANWIDNLPKYFDGDLQVLISHTMIRGIPLSVVFSSGGASLSSAPDHSTFDHFLFSHFRLKNGNNVNADQYKWLNPYDPIAKRHLLKAAIATGAFPVGLRFREWDKNDFSEEYIKNVLSRLIEGDMSLANPPIKNRIKWPSGLQDYISNTVDGGAINNEPYGEVQTLLKGMDLAEAKGNFGKPYHMQGMIMIDPFPDLAENYEYEHKDDLMGVIPGLIGTLWDQSKVKRQEMKTQFDEKVLRGTIFPRKYDANAEPMQYPIACESLFAFGGFIDVDFRIHDFFLGRNNARTYIRQYLSAPYDPGNDIIHPLHREPYWTQAMRDKFVYNDGSKDYLPFVPDMNMIIDNVNSSEQTLDYDIPEFPTYTKQEVNKLEGPIRKRVTRLINIAFSKMGKLKFFERIVIKKIKKKAIDGAVKGALDTIKKDLEKTGVIR